MTPQWSEGFQSFLTLAIIYDLSAIQNQLFKVEKNQISSLINSKAENILFLLFGGAGVWTQGLFV
jgi:hypothetical protein